MEKDDDRGRYMAADHTSHSDSLAIFYEENTRHAKAIIFRCRSHSESEYIWL